MNIKSRALIYFLFNSEGNFADYVVYQLNEYKKHCDFILLVVNGKLKEPDKLKALNVVDSVLERQNTGMDVGAYKDGIYHLGLDKLENYDEVVLANYTCFGPVFPFEELFSWAEKQHVDFWALTPGSKCMQHKGNFLHKNSSLLHYQSYFLVLRKKFLLSKEFQKFLNDLPEDITYEQSVNYFEYAFPGYFEQFGFKSSVYCDSSDLEYPLIHNPVHLLKKYRIPLIKIRSFFHHYTDTINHDAGLATLFLMDFLKKNTKYPEKLIWSYLLKEKNLAEIIWPCQLNFTLPKEQVINPAPTKQSNVGCVFHAYFEDLFDETLGYLEKLYKANVQILITTDTQKKRDILATLCNQHRISIEIKVIENRGRDVSALLVGASDFISKFDLVLFAHDKKSSQYPFKSVGRSWRLKLYEDTMGSSEYIRNVINLFLNQPNLGIAFPPYPRHSIFSEGLGSGWTGNFDDTKKFLSLLNLSVKINEHLLCISPLGTCFWFRPKALAPLFAGFNGEGWNYNDFPVEPCKTDHTILHVIERSYCYVAQSQGFYPAFIQSDFLARNEFTNLEFNQTGLATVRGWINWFAAKSCGITQPNPEDIVSINNNLSIRQNLILLAKSIRRKYPKSWAIILPIRKLSKKILKIRS